MCVCVIMLMKRQKTEPERENKSPPPPPHLVLNLPNNIPAGYLSSFLGVVDASLLHEEILVALVNSVPGPKVFKSPVAGYGLFADQDYNTESSQDYIVIAIYNGIRYERDPRGVIPKKNDRYLLKFTTNDDRDYHVDGTLGFGLMEKGRWINHKSSNDGHGPNAAWRIAPGTNHLSLNDIVIQVYLIDNVRKGEEIFIDYGPEYFPQ